MAKLYGEIAAKALLTLDKSFARANGQPLDASEVYYSLQAAKDYAATAQAYIGQKIVVIENGVVTHYSVEDTAGNLKELGAKPVADGTTIEIGEDGKITLANLEDKTSGTYNAVLVNGELTWVKPSETTVEGLSDLISALTGRVDGHDTAIKANADAIAAEVEAARAAEKALGERIDAIDFIDADELTTAISDARTLISKEIDDDVKVAKDRADAAYTLAESKLDVDDYAADKVVLNTAIAAAKKAGDDAQATIDAFLTSEEIDETVNTLKEIQTELDKLGEAVELEEQFAAKADKTYVDKELAKKQDVIAANTYDAYGAAATAKSEAIADAEGKIATAKQEAIDAAASAAAGLYATKTELSDLETAIDGRLDVLEAYEHDTYATKAELQAHDEAAAAAYATKEELAPVKQTASNAAAKIETLEDKIEEITSVGGEPNVIDYVKVNGTILEVEKDAEGKSTKTVNVIVPTKFSEITDNSGFDARITAAQNAADAAQSTANNAASAAAQAQSEVDALEAEVGGIQTTVAGHTTTIGEHTTKIGALEQADIAHATEYSTLNGIVSGHTQAIATKAEQTAVDAVVASAAANASAIKTINETTVPAINGEIAKKANATDVYTKSEVNAITGTLAEGKTLVDMINAAKAEATYDDTAVKGLITAEETRAKKAEADLTAEIEKTNAAVAAIIENTDEEGLNSIKELAAWINTHGATAEGMVDAIEANAAAITAINDKDTGILANANKYTDDAIAGLPAATVDALGLVKFDNSTIKMNESQQLYVAKVSTDILEMGTQELVLNGGSAV